MDAQKRYNQKVGYKSQKEYHAKMIKRVNFSLNKETDADIIEFLESVENKNGLLKDLVREYMERS